MRAVTATEKYNAVLEGKMAKKEFVRQMRQQYPMYVSQFSGFDDTVQILKNRQMVFENIKPAFSEAKVYDDRPALTYSLDALERGIRIELDAKGITTYGGTIKSEDFYAAEKKAKDNLEKDPNHYLNLMSGESKKVDKHDKEKEVKRGSKDKDVFNGMKKATLKEEVEIQKEEFEMSEDAKKNLLGQVVGALRTNYPDITAGILKDFIKTHYQDLLDGADIEDEFREYISVNYEGPSDMGEKYDREDGDGHVGTNTDDDFEREQQQQLAQREAKGKDHDGDGDIDSDDYMAAKDKAIKKAMGKDEQIKEAIKSLIKKTLTENTLNEAATGNLSRFSDDYADFEGMTQIINQLENLVTEVEGFYAKTGEKLQKIFDSIGNVTNEEGLKVGGFIAPSIESAFKKDIQPVVRKGFMNSVKIPTIKQITQSDINQMQAQGMAEEEIQEDPKSTIFTPNF